MIVDVHNHVFPEPVIALLRDEPAFGVQVSEGAVSSGNHATHDLFPSLYDPAVKLAQIKDLGLDGAIVSLAPRLFAYDQPPDLGERMAEAANRGLQAFAAYDPARLGWMGHVPLQAPARAAELVRGLAAAGAVGVEVGTSIAERRLDADEFEPFWSAVEDVGLVVFVHPVHIPRVPGMGDFYLRNVIGNPLETTICAERLLSAGVLTRHPRARILLAHAGGFFPYQAGRLEHARLVRPELAAVAADPWSFAGQLLFDTITHDRQALAYLIARVGAENVVIGTDHPYDMGDPEPVAKLKAVADAPTFTTIAEANPERLFGGLAARA